MCKWNGRHEVSPDRPARACPEPMVKCKLDARVSAGIHETQDAPAVQKEEERMQSKGRELHPLLTPTSQGQYYLSHLDLTFEP